VRQDYFNDPERPEGQRRVPSVTAVVVDDGLFLWCTATDNDLLGRLPSRGST